MAASFLRWTRLIHRGGKAGIQEAPDAGSSPAWQISIIDVFFLTDELLYQRLLFAGPAGSFATGCAS